MDIHVLGGHECLAMLESGDIRKGTRIWEEFHSERAHPNVKGKVIELEYNGSYFINQWDRDYLLIEEILEDRNYDYIYRVWVGGRPSDALRESVEWRDAL